MILVNKDQNAVEVHGDMDVLTTDLYNLFKALCLYGVDEKEIIRCVAMAYYMLKVGDQYDPCE